MSFTRKEQGVEDVRRNLSVLLECANRGQTVVITKRGKPFAAIVPVNQAAQKNPGMPLSALRGSGKGLWGRNGGAWVDRLRKEW